MDSLNGAMKSKTIWVNILGLVILIANSPQVAALGVPDEVIVSVLAVANMIMRFFTSQSLAEKGAS